MLSLRFRLARPEDVDAIVALVESAYRGEPSRAGWTTEADLLDGQRTDRQDVLQAIAAPGSRIVLAHPAEEPSVRDPSPRKERPLVGSVLVHANGAARVAHIGMFAVRPTLQSRGVGSALLEEAERVARDELAATRGEMTVIEQRLDILAWYERRGYLPTGATEPFPYGNPRFGLPRRADLRFVVLAKALSGE